MTKKIKGFTLIELLVVMSIIAFLLLASLAGLTYGLKKARDTSRERAITTIQTALLAYYNDTLEFPVSGTDGLTCSGSSINVTVNGQSVTASRCDVTSLVGLNDSGSAADANNNGALGKYFEEGFRSPIAISGSKDLDNAMAYYVTSDGAQYALCALTELKSSGNVDYTDQSGHDWGCYCVGPIGSAIACNGLTNPTGAQ